MFVWKLNWIVFILILFCFGEVDEFDFIKKVFRKEVFVVFVIIKWFGLRYLVIIIWWLYIGFLKVIWLLVFNLVEEEIWIFFIYLMYWYFFFLIFVEVELFFLFFLLFFDFLICCLFFLGWLEICLCCLCWLLEIF